MSASATQTNLCPYTFPRTNSSLASLLDNVSVKLETGGDCAHLNGELPNLDWTDLQGDSQSLENRDTKFIVH